MSSKIFDFEVSKTYCEGTVELYVSFVNLKIGEHSEEVEDSFQSVQVVFPQDWTIILILIMRSKLFSLQLVYPS